MQSYGSSDGKQAIETVRREAWTNINKSAKGSIGLHQFTYCHGSFQTVEHARHVMTANHFTIKNCDFLLTSAFLSCCAVVQTRKTKPELTNLWWPLVTPSELEGRKQFFPRRLKILAGRTGARVRLNLFVWSQARYKFIYWRVVREYNNANFNSVLVYLFCYELETTGKEIFISCLQ